MKVRVVALMLGALLLSAMPAAAQSDATVPEADKYAGVATATSLELSLAGEGLTVGFTDVAVQSGPSEDGCPPDQVACAQAAGELLLGETAEAWAPGNEGPNTATAFELPPELEQLLVLDIGTAVAEASTLPSADADADAATTELTLTETLANEVEVQEPLQTISDGLLDPIADSDPTGLTERLKTTLDTIIANLDENPLLTLAVGPSHSEAINEGGITSAEALSQGAELLLVPFDDPVLLEAGIPALAIVEVSRAQASATTDGATGQASADPSLARISVLDTTTLSYDVLEVTPGESACALEDTALVICVSVADSEVVQDGSNAAAAANGVRIEAFADPLPQLVLGLAAAEAGVSAALPPPPPPPAEPAQQPLPTTGLTFLLPGLALIGVGGASVAAMRRRRV